MGNQYIFFFLIFTWTAFSQTLNCNNPLLSVFNFSSRATPSAQSGISFCKSIKDKQTCCSADLMNTFQDKINTVRSRLINLVIERDRFFDKTLKDLTPQYAELNERFNSTAWKALQKLEQTNPRDKLALAIILNLIGNKALAFEEAAQDLRATFDNYQKMRSACVTRMLKIQAAAWCLACDPDYSSKGVASDGQVLLSSKVCGRVKRVCYPFAVEAKDKSLIAQAAILLSVYKRLLDQLDQIVVTGTLPAFDFTTSSVPESERPVNIPSSSCLNDATCDWICENFIYKGVLNESLVAMGGSYISSNLYENDFFQRILEGNIEEENEPLIVTRSRSLQTGSWSPDDDEAGIDAYFEEDPAKVSQFGERTILIMHSSLILLLVVIM